MTEAELEQWGREYARGIASDWADVYRAEFLRGQLSRDEYVAAVDLLERECGWRPSTIDETVDSEPTQSSVTPTEQVDTGEGGLFEYVAERDVDADAVAAVTAGRDFASTHLNVSQPPRIRYFRAATSISRGQTFRAPDRLGQADIGGNAIEVCVDDDLTVSELVEIACHEVRHIAQGSSAVDEDDAKRYGEWAAGVLVTRTPSDSERVGKTYAIDEWPSEFTLRGTAEHGDVVTVHAYGSRRVFLNANSRQAPRWQERRCPVATR